MKNKPLFLTSLTCPKDNYCVVPEIYTTGLKVFQVEGVRFLYEQHQKKEGAVLNDEDGLGKTIQTVVFASAIQTILPSISCLIVCKETHFDHWSYHIHNWSNFPTTTCNGTSQVVKSGFYLSSVDDTTILQSHNWNIVIIDDLDPIDTIKILHKIKCRFKIWLANKNLIDHTKELYQILNWVSSQPILSRKEFDLNFVGNDESVSKTWFKRQQLNIYCRQWLLRRTKNMISNDLPLLSLKIFKEKFKKWKEITRCGEKTQTQLFNSSKENSDSSLILIEDEKVDVVEIGDSETEQCSPSLLSHKKISPMKSPKKNIDLENIKRKGTKDITGLKLKRSKVTSLNDNNKSNGMNPTGMETDKLQDNSLIEQTNKCESSGIFFNNDKVKEENASSTTPVVVTNEIEEDCVLLDGDESENKKFRILDSILFASKSISR